MKFSFNQAQVDKHNTVLLLLTVVLLSASVMSVFSVLTLVLEQLASFDRLASVRLFTAFAGLMFCASMVGGWFGGRVMSYLSTVAIGASFLCIGGVGLFALSFHPIQHVFFIANLLAFVVVGYGLVCPCIITAFGENIQRRFKVGGRYHASFVMNYMAMNLGGVLGVLFSMLWKDPAQNRNNFLIASVLMLLVMVIFTWIWRRGSFQGPKKDHLNMALVWGLLVMVVLGATCLLMSPLAADIFLLLLISASAGYVLWSGYRQGKATFRRLVRFLLLTALTVVFFVLYNLEPDGLSLFVDEYVSRHILGFTLPAAAYFIFNPLFNLLFGIVLFVGLVFARRSLPPSVWVAMSIVLMGLGFYLLGFSTRFMGPAGLSSGWVILTYAILSLAEMILAPVAYEVIFLYGTQELHGVMTGMSQLAIGVGAFLMQRLSVWVIPAGHTVTADSLHFFTHGFTTLGWVWMAFGMMVFVGLGLGQFLMKVREGVR